MSNFDDEGSRAWLHDDVDLTTQPNNDFTGQEEVTSGDTPDNIPGKSVAQLNADEIIADNNNDDAINNGNSCSSREDVKPRSSVSLSRLNNLTERVCKVVRYVLGDELHLSRLQAAVILLSFSYGSAVVILPYTVLTLGPVTWMLFVAIVVVITGYCAYLNNQSTCYLIAQSKTDQVLRDPYPAIGELAAGPIFRNVVSVTMYVAMVTNSLAYMLLAASLLNDTFPFHDWLHYNSVRMWAFILCIPVAPLMFFGSFVDLMGAATFAISASTISLLAIFTNCMAARFSYDAQSYSFTPSKPITDNDIFITFGLITFTVSGPSFALPNILVHVKERKKFPHTLAYTFMTIFILYVFSGTIPFAIFGEHTGQMVTQTFWGLAKRHPDSLAIPILTAICDISMAMHLLLEAILVINPLYQHVEDYLDIPRRINIKRIGVRTCGIIVILVSCLAFPSFRSVLSIVGGVPLTLVGIIYPLFIHTMIFENNVYTKILHAVLATFFLVFMIGNLGVSIFELVETALYAGHKGQLPRSSSGKH